jgi:DNA-binding response OmpR family regulator
LPKIKIYWAKQSQILCLTNVYLKGIPAHDAMLQLKQKFPTLPVLMVSGLPDEKVISEWRLQEGFDVFPKPFTCSGLVTKVRQMLRRVKGRVIKSTLA